MATDEFPVAGGKGSGEVAQRLGEELLRVRAQLRDSIDQHGKHVEELRASNRQLQAVNEELRKVNQDLKIRIEEQAQAVNDMQNLINSTDIGTIFLDRSSRIRLFTPQARGIFNLIPADRGRPLADISSELVPPDLPADVERALDRLEHVEREVQTRDGRWYLMHVIPYRTTENRIDGVVLTFLEITRRRQAEERLRISEERLRRALGIETVAVMFFRPDGTITDTNRAFCLLSGYSRQDVKEGRVRRDDLAPPEWRAHSERAFEQLESRGWTTPYEREYVRKDGSRGWALSAATRLSRDEGAEFVIDITRDFNDRKQWESALRREHDALETSVTDRTRDLAEANRALESEVRERRAGEERVRMLLTRLVSVQEEERGRIARDLHDHLGQQTTALRLKLESLNALAEHDAALRDRLEDTLALTAQLDRDLDILTWELRPAALDLLGIVLALGSFVQEWSRNYGIPVEFHTNGADIRLTAPVETNLYRIAQEALNNICKHAQPSRVDVLLERRDGHVVLIIEDDGAGFELVGEPAAPDLHGRGMGLLGMRERTALMGGTLEIETAPGKGTTVFIAVPVPPDGGDLPQPR